MKSDNSKNGTILFRVEASRSMGTGHLMRCLALADICKERDMKALFAICDCPTSLSPWLSKAGASVMQLNNGDDASELLMLIKKVHPTGIVIDGYQFDETYRRALSSSGLPVLAMDDGVTKHALHADIVVNASPLACAVDYQTIAPKAHLLLGPAYALLRDEFRHIKQDKKSTPSDQQHILVIN